MNKLIKYTASLGIILLACLMHSCSDDTLVQQETDFREGAPLNMGISFGESVNTRLAELPNAGEMNEDKDNYGLQHVGLYIYYKDDYEKKDLSKPYIRNLKCKVKEGRLIPETGEEIYIYDRMTVVAFYPYNKDMSERENFFTKPIDEEAYPISRSDYSTQTYIPYRAQLDTDPTIAYLAQLWFYPKHTAKIEIVLVANNENEFPAVDDNLKILPAVDPVSTGNGGDGYTTDKREKWYDGINVYPKDGAPVGGKYARQYVAYIWKSKKGDPHHDNNTPLKPGVNPGDDRNHWDNIIHEGDVVFTSDKLTLLASQLVDLNEQQVYRYGYNLNTGEIFIPTSSKIVHDAQSLQDASFNKSNAYQVCDIDLSGFAWTPKSIADASFDGGGHQIMNLNINATVAAGVADTPVKQQYGLFDKISGNSYLRNVNLVKPVITVDGSASVDTCFVGALCGQINPSMTEAEKEKLANSMLPEGLSETVKKALMEDILKGLLNSTSQIIGCRVENPVITVKGKAARVGGLCGAAGDKDEDGNYNAKIWDSYVSGGSIKVNEDNKPFNEKVCAGGFCGLNNGKIERSYTTMPTVTAKFNQPAAGGETTPKKIDNGVGFAWQGNRFTAADTYIKVCYTKVADAASKAETFSTTAWPGSDWVTYTGRWPVYTNDWAETGGTGNHPATRSFWQKNGSAPDTYPILLWEDR